MKVLGISALGHDASVAFIEYDKILFASQTERFSRLKNDYNLNQEIIDEVLRYGVPDVISFYENSWNKKLRQLKAGQYDEVFHIKNLFKQYFKQFNFPKVPIIYQSHHMTHAASGYYTSEFDEAVILCIDAIGESSTLSIWTVNDGDFKLQEELKYPHSIGLMYSAFTERIGLKPNEDEYILMGMVGYGEPIYTDKIRKDFLVDSKDFKTKYNFHKGIPKDYLKDAKDADIAASIQKITEEYLEYYIQKAKKFSDNLIYCGGVAMNCLANRLIPKYFDNVHIPSNPGDSGSSIGAACLTTRQKVSPNPFLGYSIEGDYPIEEVLEELLKGNVVGVANGRAEFGQRALGNRSLLADPRGPLMQDKVNEIKKRQKFRPFSPSILEEHANDYFEMYRNKSPYMQYIFKVKDINTFPAITHIDGTARVQTVSKDDNPGFRRLLERFYEETGCPMLLNTSLNIKGQPIINNIEDVEEFKKLHNIKVFTSEL